jgi:hypothetical protein
MPDQNGNQYDPGPFATTTTCEPCRAGEDMASDLRRDMSIYIASDEDVMAAARYLHEQCTGCDCTHEPAESQVTVGKRLP